ncbi:MAG: biliverdin-producing heme oxygenase [Legionellaceae bacterium]|nr:biliverdin-producing heme oxygenase [Legionellaceae bacterium]
MIHEFHIPALFRTNHLIHDIDAISCLIADDDSHVTVYKNRHYSIRSPEHCLGVFYTRYLGDLLGGKIIKQLLFKKYDLTLKELNFYSFNNLPCDNETEIVQVIKKLFNELKLDSNQQLLIIHEAQKMFEYTSRIMDKAMYISLYDCPPKKC